MGASFSKSFSRIHGPKGTKTTITTTTWGLGWASPAPRHAAHRSDLPVQTGIIIDNPNTDVSTTDTTNNAVPKDANTKKSS